MLAGNLDDCPEPDGEFFVTGCSSLLSGGRAPKFSELNWAFSELSGDFSYQGLVGEATIG